MLECGWFWGLASNESESDLDKRSASGPKGGLRQLRRYFKTEVGRLWASVGNAAVCVVHTVRRTSIALLCVRRAKALFLSGCESILPRSHWVLRVMDVCARRLIGFGVERASIDGVSVCRMFNQAIAP